MSDASQGPGWWQAADGLWYPPDQPPAPGWWRASDGNWYPPADGGEAATAAAAAAAPEPTPDAPPVPPAEPVTTPPADAPPTVEAAAVDPTAPPSPQPEAAPAPAPAAVAPGAPPTKGRGKGPLIAIGILVVLVLIAGVAFVTTRGGDEPTEIASGNSTTTAATGDDGGNGDAGGGGDDSGGGGGGDDDGGEQQPAEISDEMPSDDITLTDDVVIVNSEKGAMFKGFSPDGTAMLLDPAAENADQLEAGKILLLSGITVVKVASVEDTEEGLVVTGEPVTLPEVIEEGELEWDDVGLDPNTARLRLYDGEAVGGTGGGSGGGTSGGSDDELTEEEILEEGGGGIVDGLGIRAGLVVLVAGGRSQDRVGDDRGLLVRAHLRAQR